MKHRKRKIKIIFCVNILGEFTKALSSFLKIAKTKIPKYDCQRYTLWIIYRIFSGKDLTLTYVSFLFSNSVWTTYQNAMEKFREIFRKNI